MTIVPITVIVLTFNEEKNIKRCLESVKNWATEIIVLDSGSTDATLDIVKFYTTKIYTHPFDNYAAQRNWAFANLPISEDWIMNIDADHELTNEIKAELSSYFSKGFSADINGFMASRRIMFMNHWVKRGGMYPVYHGVVFKKGFGFCEDKLYDQHFVINGEAILLKGDVLDVITDSLTNFTARHNKWATLEAQDAFQLLSEADNENVVKPEKGGNPMEQRRFQRLKYYKYPMFWRVFLYFLYRYFIKFGFLDGKQGLIFHFLQGFWFRFLVDSKIYEANQKVGNDPKDIQNYFKNP